MNKAQVRNNKQHLEMLYRQAQEIKRKRDLQNIEKLHQERDQLNSPQLSEKTLRVYATNRGQGPIEDRLIKHADKIARTRRERQIDAENSVRNQASPTISKYAQKLQRNGHIVDRLMQFQAIYESNHLKRQRAASPETTFSPRINRNYEVVRPALTPRRPRKLYQEEFPFKPVLDKHSMALVANRTQPLRHARSCKPETFSFHPTINQKSRKLDPNLGESPRWASLYHLNLEQRQKLELKRLESQTEDIECTFQPITARSSNGDPEKTVNRLHQWLFTKEAKLQKLRNAEKDKELAGCTFKPLPLYQTETRQKAEGYLNTLMISRIEPPAPTYTEQFMKKSHRQASFVLPIFESDVTSNAYDQAIKELHDLLYVEH